MVYKETGKITTLSIGIKVTIAVLLLFQLYLQLFKAGGLFNRNLNDYDNDLGHILEYTMAFTILFYMMAFGIDLKDYKMAYREVKNWFNILT